MKINNKYLHIPPHVSTQWNSIKSLYMKGSLLVIDLLNNETIQIPGLEKAIIEEIFSAHVNFLESESTCESTQEPVKKKITATAIPIEFSFDSSPEQMEVFSQMGINSFEELSSAMQHNNALAFAPDLPEEMLSKISTVIKALSPDDLLSIAPAEIACNCPHCQITRAIRGEAQLSEANHKEQSNEDALDPVLDSDLRFQQWDIQEISNNLYSITNKLDKNENYNVFLGTPVGCTCGNNGCEHILAVLNS